jgi:hypothetical protein
VKGNVTSSDGRNFGGGLYGIGFSQSSLRGRKTAGPISPEIRLVCANIEEEKIIAVLPAGGRKQWQKTSTHRSSRVE